MKKIISLSFIFFLIDQIVKIIINNTLNINESITVINNFFKITYVKNDGAAFSILSGNVNFLIILSIIALIILIYYLIKKVNFNKFEILSYSLLIAGISGNLIDRIFRNSVIDYLDFNIFGYNFPIFNIADICIVIGCLILILFIGGEKDGV
jgi:signal peptidase II